MCVIRAERKVVLSAIRGEFSSMNRSRIISKKKKLGVSMKRRIMRT